MIEEVFYPSISEQKQKRRKLLDKFKNEMEKTLEKHDNNKGVIGWGSGDFDFLLNKFDEEINEFNIACDAESNERAAEELIDVVNIALMLWDLLKKEK